MPAALRTVAVVTGTRAEFGLLKPVMHAIAQHPQLQLRVIMTGTHLLPPAETWREVAAEFAGAVKLPMQTGTETKRSHEAQALGRGVDQFSQHFEDQPADFILVLGDRIEALAAAMTGALSGVRVAHLHGGDRAEGIADESIRHAITKLAHIHFPATATSAMRIVAMGEDPARVHIVGSPAIDGLAQIPSLSDNEFIKLGSPRIVILLHPTGEPEHIEQTRAAKLLGIAQRIGACIALHPNHDPGRNGIVTAIGESSVKSVPHLPREQFVGLLRRVTVLVGNSSAGLIECAALPVRCINLGSRQNGREKPSHVTDIPTWDYQTLEEALQTSLSHPCAPVEHPYGDGSAGVKTANHLATLDLAVHGLRKLNTY